MPDNLAPPDPILDAPLPPIDAPLVENSDQAQAEADKAEIKADAKATKAVDKAEAKAKAALCAFCGHATDMHNRFALEPGQGQCEACPCRGVALTG